MARRHYMGKVEVLVSEARMLLNNACIPPNKLARYKELKARIDGPFFSSSNMTKEEWEEWNDLNYEIGDALEDRKRARVFIEAAERLAKEGGIAFVVDGEMFGDPNPKEIYKGYWTPSDCYDEDGFINDLLDCYEEK